MDARLRSALIDQLVELYCEWREDSARLQAAYERFSAAEPPDRTLAYAVYLAALDQEESAALTYADQIGRVAAQIQPETELVTASDSVGRGPGR